MPCSVCSSKKVQQVAKPAPLQKGSIKIELIKPKVNVAGKPK